MGVTQYIGARYVPVFADPINWDISLTYEPLTIVLYGGASYTSKQHVPAGIQITNEDYWAITGNYNAQIEQYRAETRQALQTASTAQEIADGAEETANNALTAANTAIATAEGADTTAHEANSRAATAINNANEAITIANQNNTIITRLNSIYYMPETFGAVGDGETDDTDAFKAMLEAVPNYSIILLSQKYYKITDTLVITKKYLTITAMFKNEYTPALMFSGEGYTNCIEVYSQGLSLNSVVIDGDIHGTNQQRWGILLDGGNIDGNLDVTMQNCTFIYLSHGVIIRGRNVAIDNCLFSQFAYTADNRAAIFIDQMSINTARRGVFVTNCRFHGCTICMRNNISSYSEIHTITVTDCYFDMCNIAYMGLCDNLVFDSNRFIQCRTDSVILNLGECIQTDTAISICNNLFSSNGGSKPFQDAVRIAGGVSGRFKINSNLFYTAATAGNVVNFFNAQSATNNVYFTMCDNYIESNTPNSGVLFHANNSSKAFKGLLANNVFYIPNGSITSTVPATVTTANNVTI